MTIVRYQTNNRMSQAVAHGTTLYLAGQVSKTPAGDVAGQTAAVLAQIDDLLKHGGSAKDRILSATVYLADIKTFAEMNKSWEAWVVPGQAPTRTTLEAKLAAPDYLVEITIVAARFHHE
jgi:enamine deaminase RidA (YjgF/YER057c/UK114 family)